METTETYYNVIRINRMGRREVIALAKSEAYARDQAKWYEGAFLEPVEAVTTT